MPTLNPIPSCDAEHSEVLSRVYKKRYTVSLKTGGQIDVLFEDGWLSHVVATRQPVSKELLGKLYAAVLSEQAFLNMIAPYVAGEGALPVSRDKIENIRFCGGHHQEENR